MAYSCFRLLTDNYADTYSLANLDASSEQGSFPAENVTAKKRRAKSWRSGGYWNIESGSNIFIFQEDGINDLIASITVGEYTTTASFLTAIKTAMENTTTSGVTYTVSVDTTTNKIKIVSDGNGGATLNLIWTDPQSADMADIMGFSTATDDTGSLTYLADSLKISTEEFLTFDLGLPTSISAFALLGNRNSPISLSPSATIKLQASPTDAWVTPSFETSLTYDGNSIFSLNNDGFDNGNKYRYWRLLILDNENANGYLEINSIFLGNQFNPTTGRVQFPLSSTLEDLSKTVASESGVRFSNSKPRSQNYQIRWFNLSKDEIEAIEDLWITFGTSIPLFVSLDSSATWSNSANRRMIMARFKSEPTYQFEKPDLFTMTMSFEEEL